MYMYMYLHVYKLHNTNNFMIAQEHNYTVHMYMYVTKMSSYSTVITQ